VLSNNSKKYLTVALTNEAISEEISNAIDAGDNTAALAAAAVADAKAVAAQNDANLSAQVSHTFYVDCKRTDTYVENGSSAKPFKTIQAAINQIIANNDDALDPYCVYVQNGKYYETIVIESLNIHRLKLIANGVVQIRPTTNQALRSITNNTNLVQFHITGFTFLAPVVITGANASTAFGDVIWDDCNFVAGDGAQIGDLTLTCINNITIRRSYLDINQITYSNVNYSIIDDSNIGAMFAITMDSTANKPSQGSAGAILVNNSMLMGGPIFTKVGTATLQFITNSSTLLAGMSTGTVTIPTGVTVSAYSSFYRGTWTNNGVLNLRNSNVNALAGTAPVLSQAAGQVGNDSNIAGVTVKDALNNLLGIDHTEVINAKTFTWTKGILTSVV
jgi:hypothetical protein